MSDVSNNVKPVKNCENFNMCQKVSDTSKNVTMCQKRSRSVKKGQEVSKMSKCVKNVEYVNKFQKVQNVFNFFPYSLLSLKSGQVKFGQDK